MEDFLTCAFPDSPISCIFTEMNYKDKLDNCLVSLDVGEKNALLIVLAADGTICRRGNGNPDKELPLLKGQSDLEHYRAFMMTVHEELFQFSGVFDQTPIVGSPCKMMIVFSGPDGEEAGFKCTYGLDSQGPPREIVEMLVNAVKITDPWYEREREKLSGPSMHDPQAGAEPDAAGVPRRKWWQVFK
jgi:hypothetical protein